MYSEFENLTFWLSSKKIYKTPFSPSFTTTSRESSHSSSKSWPSSIITASNSSFSESTKLSTRSSVKSSKSSVSISIPASVATLLTNWWKFIAVINWYPLTTSIKYCDKGRLKQSNKERLPSSASIIAFSIASTVFPVPAAPAIACLLFSSRSPKISICSSVFSCISFRSSCTVVERRTRIVILLAIMCSSALSPSLPSGWIVIPFSLSESSLLTNLDSTHVSRYFISSSKANIFNGISGLKSLGYLAEWGRMTPWVAEMNLGDHRGDFFNFSNILYLLFEACWTGFLILYVILCLSVLVQLLSESIFTSPPLTSIISIPFCAWAIIKSASPSISRPSGMVPSHGLE